MSIGITALGAYLPARALHNTELEQHLDTNHDWIVQRTGIHQRHLAAEGQSSSALAIQAVADLLRRCGERTLEGVGMVIVATGTPDEQGGGTALAVSRHFGLSAGAFDLSAACSGWVYGLSVAQGYIRAGICQKVLVIGAEVFSRIVDWQDRTSAILFGDGASAAVVERVGEGFGFLASTRGTDGLGGKFLHASALASCLPDGTLMRDKITMDGKEVYKFAVRTIVASARETVRQAGVSWDDIALLVPHQANARIIEAAREQLGLAREKVVVTVDQHANTSAASVGLALTNALDAGRLHRGDHVLLVSFGAGLNWAATLLRWSGVLESSGTPRTLQAI